MTSGRDRARSVSWASPFRIEWLTDRVVFLGESRAATA